MNLKLSILAGALSVSLALPTYANDATELALLEQQPASQEMTSDTEGLELSPTPQFATAEVEALFEQDDKPMQLAALSQQEMKETEGAWYWIVYL